MIEVKSADGGNGIGVEFVATSSRSEALSVLLFTKTNGERKQYNVTTVKLGEIVPVSIDIKDNGVRAKIAGQVAEIPLQLGTGAEVRVTCSTGQFVFEKLEMAAAD